VRAGYAYAEVSQRLKGTAFPLWRREALRNGLHSAVLLGTLLIAAVATIARPSLWPLAALGAFYLVLVLRTAYKVRWKSTDRWTLFCYGIHSHLQQIPISVGQLSYWWDRWRGRQHLLIEYK
jgi:apolipoprotein N-acyltransferase